MQPGDQIFRTIPFPNTGVVLYGLAIIAPNTDGTPIAQYTFPISPASVRKEFVSKANFFDIAGSTQQSGVQRLVDFYGVSPVIYTLEGTTGWQLHSTDAFAFTGAQSIVAIQNLINQFAQLNVAQAQANQPLYTMEFYDYFSGDFWQVVPIGRQGISQSERRPLLYDYYFRLVGIQNLAVPITAIIPDVILDLFSVSAAQALSTLSTNIAASLVNYASVTPGGISTIAGL